MVSRLQALPMLWILFFPYWSEIIIVTTICLMPVLLPKNLSFVSYPRSVNSSIYQTSIHDYNYHVHDHLLLDTLKGGYHHKVETDLQWLVPVGKYSRKYTKYLRYVTMPKKTHTLVSAKHLSIINRGVAPVFWYVWLKTTTHWSISTDYNALFLPPILSETEMSVTVLLCLPCFAFREFSKSMIHCWHYIYIEIEILRHCPRVQVLWRLFVPRNATYSNNTTSYLWLYGKRSMYNICYLVQKMVRVGKRTIYLG